MNAIVPFFSITLILIGINLPTSLSRHSREYKTCSKNFTCHKLTSLSYPFYGLDRPAYCGHPKFELLGCDNATEFDPVQISILSQQFYVLGINSTSSTITVNRVDLYRSTGCPGTLTNITIDFSLFQYTAANINISLLYGNCSSVCANHSLPSLKYDCLHVDGKSGTNPVCFLNKEMMLKHNITLASCPTHLFLPLQKRFYESLNESSGTVPVYGGARTGFELEWSANNDLCQTCRKKGGQCGHNLQSNQFFCICPNCRIPGITTNKKTLSNSKIGLIVSISAIGTCSTIVLVYYFKRKFWLANQELEDSQTRKRQDVEVFLKSYGFSGPKRYTYTEIKKITNSFRDELGEGGYGTVYRGTLQHGQLVAVKILKKSEGDIGEFINEVATIGMTNHVNVVTLLGFCYENSKRALIYEFMPNGSLEKFVYGGKNNQHLAWEKLFQIAIGTARGLEYLHRGCNTRILHFDIKPHNILLDETFCPKISDFGLAKSCPQKDSMIISMSEARGTIGYIAPEVYLRSFGGVSYKSDVYSYGMLVLEMVGCRKNAEAENEDGDEEYFPQWIYKQLERGEENDEQADNLSWEEKELQRKMMLVSLWCVQTSPSSRPTMSKVVEMLEGSLEALQIPPTLSLSSSLRSQVNCSTSTTIST